MPPVRFRQRNRGAQHPVCAAFCGRASRAWEIPEGSRTRKDTHGHGQDPAHRHGRRGRPESHDPAAWRLRRAGRPRHDLAGREQRGRSALPSAERGQQARLRAGHADRVRSVHERAHLGRLQEPAHGRDQGSERRRPGRPGDRPARLRGGHRRGPACGRRPLDDPRQQEGGLLQGRQRPQGSRHVRRSTTASRVSARTRASTSSRPSTATRSRSCSSARPAR